MTAMRQAPPIDWLSKLRLLLQVTAFALAIPAIQYAFQPERPYEVRYSLCIAFFTWALIDFGRHLFASSMETGWPKGVAGVALSFVGIVVGYLLGTLVADWWCGWPGGSFAPEARGQLRTSVVITALAGTACTYFFYSSNKSDYFAARMHDATLQANEARLKLLETQLEPHMLFNTLANLRALIAADPARAQNMLDHLIDYLRATLSASRASTHTLEQEFARLHDYLALMAVRMGRRLQYTLDLPDALKPLTVPPLLLQPLVENSIQHGLEPKVEGGSITVQARQEGGLLVLEVIDTGLGLNPDASTSPPHSAPGKGFGLSQVRERLATLYGNASAIKLVAGNAGGTRASITIPLQT